jgi:hypothetical protein
MAETLSDETFTALQNAQWGMRLVRKRAQDLINHAMDIGFAASNIKDGLLAMDIIRAAVVFLHASLEEFLRAVGRELLPTGRREALDWVPLLGESPVGDAKKFFLGSLRTHERKTVARLLRESVEAHLARRTFNSSSEINAFLIDCGIDASACTEC